MLKTCAISRQKKDQQKQRQACSKNKMDRKNQREGTKELTVNKSKSADRKKDKTVLKRKLSCFIDLSTAHLRGVTGRKEG